jgi:uncharacterized protein (TIGR03382 family)
LATLIPSAPIIGVGALLAISLVALVMRLRRRS